MEQPNINNSYSHEADLLNRICGIVSKSDWGVRYLQAFDSGDTAFTSFMSSVIIELATDMGLQHHAEYYATDYVFYKEEDVITSDDLPNGTSHVDEKLWLKHIRVAIEHENHWDTKGGYQEIAHLILVNADMKVLIGYAGKGRNYDAYAHDYQHIYQTASQSDFATPILLIGEYRDGHVDAYLLTPKGTLVFCKKTCNWMPLNGEGRE